MAGLGLLLPILSLRGIPTVHGGLQATTAWNDPTPTHPSGEKNHSRRNFLDALCYGSIKPSSLAPLTASPKPSPSPTLPRHLSPSQPAFASIAISTSSPHSHQHQIAVASFFLFYHHFSITTCITSAVVSTLHFFSPSLSSSKTCPSPHLQIANLSRPVLHRRQQ